MARLPERTQIARRLEAELARLETVRAALAVESTLEDADRDPTAEGGGDAHPADLGSELFSGFPDVGWNCRFVRWEQTLRHCQPWWLVACQYRLHNLRRQQRHAQYSADIGWIDVFGFGDFLNGAEVASLQ